MLNFWCLGLPSASDINNNLSEAKTVKITPQKPAHLLVVNTLEVEPDLGGISVTWKNIAATNIAISVNYKDAEGLNKTFLTSSSDVDGFTKLIGLTDEEQIFELFATSESGLESPSKFFTVTPLREIFIDKTDWTIHDFSSQEDVRESAPNGFAAAAIDGDVNTFWHSQWRSPAAVFPHHFSVDMQEVKTVSRVELFTRAGNNQGMTKFSVKGSLDGTTWTDYGEFDFDRENFEGQSFELDEVSDMRYIRITALEGDRSYTFLGELNVYGK